MEDFVTIDLHQEQIAERSITSLAAQPKSSPSKWQANMKGKDVILVSNANATLEMNKEQTTIQKAVKGKESPIAKENIDTEFCTTIVLSNQDGQMSNLACNVTVNKNVGFMPLPRPEQSNPQVDLNQLQMRSVRIPNQTVSLSKFQLTLVILLFLSSALLLKQSKWLSFFDI